MSKKKKPSGRMGRNPFEKAAAKKVASPSPKAAVSPKREAAKPAAEPRRAEPRAEASPDKPWVQVLLQDLPAALLMVSIRRAMKRAEWIARRTGNATTFERFRENVMGN